MHRFHVSHQLRSAAARASLAASAAALLCSSFALAGEPEPCTPHWTDGVSSQGVENQPVAIAALTEGDSTTYFIGSAGVAQWTGSAWQSLGGPIAVIRALAAFDDGSGLALYAAPEAAVLEEGSAKGVVRWDGSAWQLVGDGPATFGAAVFAMTTFDDGSGPALYAGGFFVGGPAPNLSRWDGKTWTPIVGGPNVLTSVSVRALAVFDDGSGPALYAGGNDLKVNGIATSLARWDGFTWTAVPGAPQNTVILAFAVHDDGSGPALYAGGFTSPVPELPLVRRFDGTSWSHVATPLNGTVRALASFDDGAGSGPSLYVAGGFSQTTTDQGPQTLPGIALLSNNAWQPVGAPPFFAAFALLPAVDITTGDAPALLVASNTGFAQWRGCTPKPEPGTPGDLNGDGAVNVQDLLILLAAWGPCADIENCPADLDDDGAVGVPDLLALLSNWGSPR